MDLKTSIRTIVDFPRAGIRFRDITSLLQHPEAFRYAVDQLYRHFQYTELHGLVAIESRGFPFAAALAYQLHVPLYLIRKQGKLPGKTVGADYQLEYGTSRLEMRADAFDEGSKIVIIDDLIATGGSIRATAAVVEKLGGSVVGCAVVIELTDLGGRENISPITLHSLVTFREDEV